MDFGVKIKYVSQHVHHQQGPRIKPTCVWPIVKLGPFHFPENANPPAQLVMQIPQLDNALRHAQTADLVTLLPINACKHAQLITTAIPQVFA